MSKEKLERGELRSSILEYFKEHGEGRAKDVLSHYGLPQEKRESVKAGLYRACVRGELIKRGPGLYSFADKREEEREETEDVPEVVQRFLDSYVKLKIKCDKLEADNCALKHEISQLKADVDTLSNKTRSYSVRDLDSVMAKGGD